MAEILLVAWVLGLIVIAIDWGGIDLLVITLKPYFNELLADWLRPLRICCYGVGACG